LAERQPATVVSRVRSLPAAPSRCGRGPSGSELLSWLINKLGYPPFYMELTSQIYIILAWILKIHSKYRELSNFRSDNGSTLSNFRPDNENALVTLEYDPTIIHGKTPESEIQFNLVGSLIDFLANVAKDGQISVYYPINVLLPTRGPGFWVVHDELDTETSFY
jgi:hypothetical protein